MLAPTGPDPRAARRALRLQSRALRRLTRPATAIGLAGLVAVGLTSACSTSAPADLTSPSASPAAAEPSASETLLAQETAGSSTVGALAPGFPTDLVPLPEGATVLVSSAEQVPGTELWTISLNLRTPQPTDDLMAAVRGPLTEAGFDEEAPEDLQAELAAQSTFSRDGGVELLTVGVLDRDDVRTLTLGGTVRVEP